MELKTYFAQDQAGSVLPNAYVYLYEKGTTNLVSGIEDKDGAALANPFQADSDGLVQLAAPDGNYDLRIASGGLDFRMRVQFLDAPAAISTIQASASQAATDAGRAETARDAAQLTAGVYVDTAAGLAATSEGGYFSVPSADDSEYLILYRHDAGPVATEVKRYPSAAATVDRLKGVRGKNLFNKDAADVALGSFPSSTNGAQQANVSYNTSGYVPVVAGADYTLSKKHYLCWYDAAQVFISGTSEANSNKTNTAPAGAAFARFSASLSNWSALMFEAGAVATDYQPHYGGVLLDPATVADRSLPGSVLAHDSVPVDAVGFIKVGKNMFNKDTILSGYFIGHDGSGPTASGSYHVSDYIAVTPGVAYHVEGASKGLRFLTYYNEYKFYMAGGVSDSDEVVKDFTPPVGAAYVRISFSQSQLASFQVEQGAVATAYAAYGYVFEGATGEKLLIDSLPVGMVATAMLADQAVTPKKVDFIQAGKNLFNKAAMTAGFIAKNGNIAASSTYSYSDYIAVTPGVQYYGAGAVGMRMLCYYDAAFAVVAGGSDNSLSTFTPPAGVTYARITITTTDASAFQLEVGAAPTAYQAYGYILQGAAGEAITPVSNAAAPFSAWIGKKWATMGDSISAAGNWQPTVVSKLGLVWSNYSTGGTQISGSAGSSTAMCQDIRIDAIPTDRDLVSVMGGTNDWAQNVPLGTENSTDPLTFHGALNTMLTKLFARFPAKRIALHTTPYGEIYDYVPRGWPDAKTNTQGLTTRDYAEAVRLAGKRWGVPVIDVSGNAGWNASNITTFITDDGALLHPNAAGAARVAEVTVGGLRSLEPSS